MTTAPVAPSQMQSLAAIGWYRPEKRGDLRKGKRGQPLGGLLGPDLKLSFKGDSWGLDSWDAIPGTPYLFPLPERPREEAVQGAGMLGPFHAQGAAESDASVRL